MAGWLVKCYKGRYHTRWRGGKNYGLVSQFSRIRGDITLGQHELTYGICQLGPCGCTAYLNMHIPKKAPHGGLPNWLLRPLYSFGRGHGGESSFSPDSSLEPVDALVAHGLRAG